MGGFAWGRTALYIIGQGEIRVKALYIKEVNNEEETTRFCQEIYNDKGRLVEIHEKFPVNKGHREIK